jgi:KaiC/GvpD/RAD55 family RecA-like ATPase
VGKETTEASLMSRLEEFADCVIELETTLHEGKTIRKLHVKKMRGRKPSEKWVRFEIDQEKGIMFLV